MLKTAGRIAAVLLCASAASGCGDVKTKLEELSKARRLSADLHVEFTRAADAANRAVMADNDERAVAFAREAEQAKQAVHKGLDELTTALKHLNYSDENRHVASFSARLAAYEELDRRILDLAVEGTNLKAQRIAFGPAQEAANVFRDSLAAVAPARAQADRWRVQALVARAVMTVREIQVLQAPHIADADDGVMTRMESHMTSSEAEAREALAALAPLVAPESRARLAEARAALDRFSGLNGQVIALSRRNTNVRSLALSLDEKRALTAACEESLQALRAALATHGEIGTASKY